MFNSGTEGDILFDAQKNNSSIDEPSYNSGSQDQSYNFASQHPSYNSGYQDPNPYYVEKTSLSMNYPYNSGSHDQAYNSGSQNPASSYNYGYHVEDDNLLNSGTHGDVLFEAPTSYNSGSLNPVSGSRYPSYHHHHHGSSVVAFTAVRAKSYCTYCNLAPYFVAFEQTLTDKGYGWNPQTSTFDVSCKFTGF